MSLEPSVISSIDKYKKKVVFEKVLLLSPFILAVILSIALLVIARTTWKPKPPLQEINERALEEDYSTQSGVSFFKVLAFCLAPLVLTAYGSKWYRSVKYSRHMFLAPLGQLASQYDMDEYLKFENALESVSIAAGRERPQSTVIEDPAANAFAYRLKMQDPVVVVTSGLLENNIPVDEANAIMAHELAHILIGENISAPKATDVEYMPGILLIAFVVTSLIAIVVAQSSEVFMLVSIVSVSFFCALVILQKSRRFIVKVLDLSYMHNDELADSVAIKLTRDPDALAGAITRIGLDAKNRHRVPGGMVMARYLFVTPPFIAGDYLREATASAEALLSLRKQPRTWLLSSKKANRAWLDILEMESRMTKERLTNIELIKQGHWRALSDWSRE
ncbi:MAG: M48 family metalloprotease [Actinomycetota bacterium]|nr:M48 family metalloprotease [Actinomycetota bacterium]